MSPAVRLRGGDQRGVSACSFKWGDKDAVAIGECYESVKKRLEEKAMAEAERAGKAAEKDRTEPA
jgi:hypothetical protein